MDHQPIVIVVGGKTRIITALFRVIHAEEGDRVRLSATWNNEETWIEFSPTCNRDILQQSLFAAGEIERALAAGKTGELKL